jgi:hypothetical protein
MNDLGAALLADVPHASLGDQAHGFDRFVGAWDCLYTHLAEDGSVTEEYDGRVTFGWIIDGWAMQDVWSGGGSVGTSIRWFDPKKGVWIVMWFAPEGAVVTRVEGGAVGDRIVLHGESQDGSLRQWSFNEIRPDSFVWRGERSSDQGATWRLEAEYKMTRRAPRSHATTSSA